MLLKICTPRQRGVAPHGLFRPTVDLDFVPDLDVHQVFAYFQRSCISFSGVGHKVRSVERYYVRIDCQFWLHPAEYRSCLFWRGVMIDHFLLLLRAEEIVARAIGLGIQHLVNQYIRPLSELDQVLGVPGITGEHYGTPRIFDAIAEGGLDRSVINGKGSDRQIAVPVDHTLLNILSHNRRALRGKPFIYVAPDVDIELVGLLQMRHHLRCSCRRPDAERCAPAKNPARQTEIRKSANVNGMQVSQK